MLRFQGALTVGQHIEAARLIVDEIGDDVARGEGSLEDLAREEARPTGQGI